MLPSALAAAVNDIDAKIEAPTFQCLALTPEINCSKFSKILDDSWCEPMLDTHD